METKKIFVIGGGFAGIKTALALCKDKPKNIKILLVSNTPHFEYHAALYRVVTGRNPLEVCIPLEEIFKNKPVEIIKDSVVSLDFKNNKFTGESGSHFSYDILVLALGGVVNFYGNNFSSDQVFTLSNTRDAIRLRNHFDKIISNSLNNSHTINIVGAGPTGVELAGELGLYLKTVSTLHHHRASFNINLIEGSPRILGPFPENVSTVCQKRLKDLGVNVLANTKFTNLEPGTTTIWTAGIKANGLYKSSGLVVDKTDRVIVNQNLQPENIQNLFVIGDSALVSNWGTAPSALSQAEYVANYIHGKIRLPFISRPSNFSIPVGPYWAASKVKDFVIYGRLGWWIRRFIDLRFFLSILPPQKALDVFREDKSISESCEICSS